MPFEQNSQARNDTGLDTGNFVDSTFLSDEEGSTESPTDDSASTAGEKQKSKPIKPPSSSSLSQPQQPLSKRMDSHSLFIGCPVGKYVVSYACTDDDPFVSLDTGTSVATNNRTVQCEWINANFEIRPDVNLTASVVCIDVP